jgi:hypothetical protein
MDEKFAVLRHGQTWKKGAIYNTLQQALDDGAVVLAYGYVGHRYNCGVAVLSPICNEC